MNPRLTVIHLVRKPLIGTVALNALKHGTGGLNIDACRIGADWSSEKSVRKGHTHKKYASNGVINFKDGGHSEPHVAGRWPANLIIQHEQGCKLVGTHFEEFSIMNYLDPTSGNFSFFAECGTGRGAVKSKKGGQMVDEWECIEGCPVKDLDEQSGVVRGVVRQPTGGAIYPTGDSTSMQWNANNVKDNTVRGYTDEGGASRYFKQGIKVQDLHEYLQTMISPPAPWPQAVMLTSWPDDIETWAKTSCTGLIIHGFTPTEAQDKILYDLLVPGGHICIVAPDDQPTGHTGAIRLEDAGFEIRDAILWVRGPGRLHYVAKAARKEREAGCSKIPSKKGFEAVEREEGSAGVANPRAGAGGMAGKVHNFHPTVKSVGIMAKILADVPKDYGPVLDPFLGSGTTLIACLQTGHDGIGIERDAEYMVIADARVRHRGRTARWPLDAAKVTTEWAQGEQVGEVEDVREELSLFDLLSW